MNGKTTSATVIASVLSPRLALSFVAALLAAAVVWAADEEAGLSEVEPGSPLILIYPPSPPSIYSAPPLKSAKAEDEKSSTHASQSQAVKTWRGIRLQSPIKSEQASKSLAGREAQRDTTERTTERASEKLIEIPAKNTSQHNAKAENAADSSLDVLDESIALPTPVAEAVFDQILEDTLVDMSAAASQSLGEEAQLAVHGEVHGELHREVNGEVNRETATVVEGWPEPLSNENSEVSVESSAKAIPQLSAQSSAQPSTKPSTKPSKPLEVKQGKSWKEAGRDNALSFSGLLKAFQQRFADKTDATPLAAGNSQQPAQRSAAGSQAVSAKVLAARKKLREAQANLLRELPLPMSQLDVAMADAGLSSYPSMSADISPLWAASGFHGVEQGAGTAPVAVFVDGVYLGEQRGLALGFFDVQALSFSPGPAAMPYAPAALSGAVQLHAVQPSGEPHARFSAGGNDSGSAWAGISIDTAEVDRLAMRLAYRQEWRDAQVEQSGGDNFGAGDVAQLRFALREATSDSLQFSYRYERDDAELNPHYYQLLRGSASASESRQDSGQWSVAPQANRIDQRRHVLGLRWLHARGELVADSLVLDSQARLSQDFGAGAALYFQQQEREQQYYQQSLRWLSAPLIDNADTRLRFELGAVYTEQDASLRLRDEEGQGGTLWRDSEQQRDLRQFTADMRWILQPLSLSPALELEAALAWQRRELDVRHSASGASFAAFALSNDSRENLISTELLARWALSESLRLEAQLRRAEQAGGFAESGSEAHWLAGGYQPESRFYRALSLYGQHFAQRLDWSLRLHQTRVEDAQYAMASDLDQPLIRDVFNSAEADIRGASVAAQWQFAPGWQWNIAYDYLDARYSELLDQTAFLTGAVANPDFGTDISATARVAYTPEHSYSSSVLYVRPLGSADLKAGLYYRWQDQRSSRVVDSQAEAFDLPHHASLNARVELNGLRLSRDARMGLGLWANNLNDEDYLLDSQALPSGEVSGRFADKRSVGLDLQLDFD